MRLTKMTDYSLRLLMYLALKKPDELCSIAEVSKVQKISEAHLMKITHRLSLAGWLETVRGKGGGIRLGKTANKINIGAVVRSIESDFELVECFSGSVACKFSNNCKLAGVINSALSEFLAHLDQYTLADIT